MRILNDTKINVAAGGFACPSPFPDFDPDVRPYPTDEYWLLELWSEREIADELFE